jgi:hypothetical protein
MVVGERYQLNKHWGKLPKGLKLKLMAILEYTNITIYNGNKIYSAVVEIPHGGSAWKFHSNDGTSIVVEQDINLNGDTLITYIPLNYLEPLNPLSDNIIIWSLANKWNSRETDSYNKFRVEWYDKYGYDIHERRYKKK